MPFAIVVPALSPGKAREFPKLVRQGNVSVTSCAGQPPLMVWQPFSLTPQRKRGAKHFRFIMRIKTRLRCQKRKCVYVWQRNIGNVACARNVSCFHRATVTTVIGANGFSHLNQALRFLGDRRGSVRTQFRGIAVGRVARAGCRARFSCPPSPASTACTGRTRMPCAL